MSDSFKKQNKASPTTDDTALADLEDGMAAEIGDESNDHDRKGGSWVNRLRTQHSSGFIFFLFLTSFIDGNSRMKQQAL